MTNNQAVEILVPLYESLMAQSDEIKGKLEDIKDKGLDHKSIASVAKAQAASKLNDLKSKTDALQKVLKEVN